MSVAIVSSLCIRSLAAVVSVKFFIYSFIPVQLLRSSRITTQEHVMIVVIWRYGDVISMPTVTLSSSSGVSRLVCLVSLETQRAMKVSTERADR